MEEPALKASTPIAVFVQPDLLAQIVSYKQQSVLLTPVSMVSVMILEPLTHALAILDIPE